MNYWLILVVNYPAENATARMRAWRSLKASGAAVLRDGVYLMPERESCRQLLQRVADEVRAGGGAAHLLRAEEPAGESYRAWFDRDQDYAALIADVAEAHGQLSANVAPAAYKRLRKLRKAYAGIAEIDFFPDEAQKQAEAALQELELAINRSLSPDEPHAAAGTIARLQIADYQGRTWATRRRPWVDRLACAWLIRRFIDPQARLLWLDSPADYPPDALGFDFDGAAFSHLGAYVSFEVLMASFGLEQPPLKRIAGLVHYLDVGGVQPPEAAGIESVLAGLREAIADDDSLLAAAGNIFDGLHAAFIQGDTSA